jgi:endothelin-converting enzyme
MSLSEADALAPVLGLADIVSALSPAGETPDFVIVASPKYMKAVGDIIDETPSDVVQNYFIWKTIQSFASYVEAEEIKPYRQFSNELAGKVSCNPLPSCILSD